VDGAFVVIKRIFKNSGELDILSYLSSSELLSDPQNHCVPVLDVIAVPGAAKQESDEILLVKPLLRAYRTPPFETVGQFVDFVEQALEVSVLALLNRGISITTYFVPPSQGSRVFASPGYLASVS
jgi:hypothetical protein